MIALFSVDLQLAVDQLRHADRAGFLNLAHLTAAALLQIYLRDPLADDAQVIQIRLDAVVWTAADCQLEFMRQNDIMITNIEQIMKFLAQFKGIRQTVLAGCAFAGNNRTNFGSGAAGF